MIVIVAGMQRSGSTFSHNAARELLERRGGVSSLATNSLEAALSEPSATQHTLVKTHAPDRLTNLLLEKNGLPCICTIRKPEDAIASWIEAFGFSLEESVATYAEWLSWHRRMASHMLNLRYEEVDRWPILAICRISRYLLGSCRIREVLRIWWRYRKSAVYAQTKELRNVEGSTTDIGFSHYDNRTFFHRRHVSSIQSRPAAERLLPEQLSFIRQALRQFIDAQGNYQW